MGEGELARVLAAVEALTSQVGDIWWELTRSEPARALRGALGTGVVA